MEEYEERWEAFQDVIGALVRSTPAPPPPRQRPGSTRRFGRSHASTRRAMLIMTEATVRS